MARISIPHIWSPNEHAPSLVSTVRDAKVKLLSFMLHEGNVVVTEKPDGIYYEIGFDADGLFTGTQTMGEIRYPSQYIQRMDFHSIPEDERDLVNFYKKSNNLSVLEQFHSFVSEESYLRHILGEYYRTHKRPIVLRGELMHPNLAQETTEDGIVYNHIKYDHVDGNIPRFIVYEYFPTAKSGRLYMDLKEDLEKYVDGLLIEGDVLTTSYTIPKLCDVTIYDEWVSDVLEGKDTPKRRDDNEYRTIAHEARLYYEHIWDELTRRFEPCWGEETEGFILHQIHGFKGLKEKTVNWNHVKVINPDFKRNK